MSIWNDYSVVPAGIAGSLVDLTAHTVDTFRIEDETGAVKCGTGVVMGANPGNGVRLPGADAAKEQFAGVVMNSGTHELDMDGNLIIRRDSSQSVMRHGRIWVRVAEGAQPAYGDPVYLCTADESAGLFGDEQSGTVALNAVYIGARQNGIAPIELFPGN